MAFPPTIPTSFVPHSTVASQKFRSDFTGAFGVFSYMVFGIVFLLALGVFFYGRILTSNQSAKDAALAEQVKKIDQTTVENFVRLRDRLSSSETLLAGHAAFSEFFSSLEKILPSTVRFSALHLSVDSSGVPKVEGSGVAKSFNALASASTAFAEDGRIKDAIFSNIDINKDSSVSFSFVATLDPKIIVFSP